MAAAVLQAIQNSVTKSLEAKIKRGKSLRAWLNRVAYAEYKNIQRERWMTENTSQGAKWPALNEKYALRKARIYAEFPGGGTKMMIAKGTLFNSVVGDDLSAHRKIVTDTTLEIHTTVDYAQYPDKIRTFTQFSPQTMKNLADSAGEYIMRGQE